MTYLPGHIVMTMSQQLLIFDLNILSCALSEESSSICCPNVVYSKHKRLSKWCLDMFHCCSTLDLVLDLLHGDTTPRLGHASIHICNRQISDEPSKSETHLQSTNQRRAFQILKC